MPDDLLAAEFSAVAIERRHASELGDLASSEGAQFGELGDQGPAGGRADAFDRLEQLVFGFPVQVVLDESGELSFDFRQLLIEDCQDGLDGSGQFWPRDLLTAIEQAERMGLIVSSSEGPEAPFRFAHEIVRQLEGREHVTDGSERPATASPRNDR